MKKIIMAVFLVGTLFTSCKNEGSIQKYLVESQDKEGFVSFDIAGSMLPVGDNVSEEVKKTLETVHKINIVALPIKGHETDYEIEKQKLKDLVKKSDYKELMRFSEKGAKIKVYYAGNKDNIDEVIAFGYHSEFGLGVARVLGDDMQPAEIMEAIKDVQFGENSDLTKKLKSLVMANKS